MHYDAPSHGTIQINLVTASISPSVLAVRELHALSPPSAGRYALDLVHFSPRALVVSPASRLFFFFFFLVRGKEKKKRLETLASGPLECNYLSFPRLFLTFADICSQLLLANRTRTSSEASPALLLSLLDSHIRSMMS